jgi:hypothetical protein
MCALSVWTVGMVRLLATRVSTVKVHVGRSLPDYMCVGWFLGGNVHVRQFLADYMHIIRGHYMRGGWYLTGGERQL